MPFMLTGMATEAFDIRLNPEELGRVQMTLHHMERGLQVQISAERGETLDLIRRHLGDLDRDLRNLGQSGVSFSFAGMPQRRQDRPTAEPAPRGRYDAGADLSVREVRPPRPGSRGGLDIRM